MSESQEGQPPEERPVLELLKDIQSKRLSPKTLCVDDRINLVEHLRADGYPVIEIAGILETTDRTIRRDLVRIREKNAVAYRPELVNEMVGRLMAAAETSILQIRRRIRDKGTAAADCIAGAYAAWRIDRELAETMQRVGYLPMAPTEIRGELHHNLGGDGRVMTLAEITRLEAIWKNQSLPQELRAKLEQLKSKFTGGIAEVVPPALPVPQPEKPKEGDDRHGTGNQL